MISFTFRSNPVRLPYYIDDSYDISWFRIVGPDGLSSGGEVSVISFTPPDIELDGAIKGVKYKLEIIPKPLRVVTGQDFRKATKCLELLQKYQDNKNVYEIEKEIIEYDPLGQLNSSAEFYRHDPSPTPDPSKVFTRSRAFEPIHDERRRYLHVVSNNDNLKMYDGVSLINPISENEGYYVFDFRSRSTRFRGIYLVNS